MLSRGEKSFDFVFRAALGFPFFNALRAKGPILFFGDVIFGRIVTQVAVLHIFLGGCS